jgi:hypothetical protein
MSTDHEGLSGHEKFMELSALANTGALTGAEWDELAAHLRACRECCEIHGQYLTLARQGIPLLAARYANQDDADGWDGTLTRRKLFASIGAEKHQSSPEHTDRFKVGVWIERLRQIPANSVALAALAASIAIASGLFVHKVGGGPSNNVKPAQAAMGNGFEKLAEEKKTLEGMLAAQTIQLSQLKKDRSQKERELRQLQAAFSAIENRAGESDASNNSIREQLRAVSLQRDMANAQVRDAELAYQNLQSELASLRSARDNAVFRTDLLESRIKELSAVTRDQQRRLGDDEQYLASDRDIRELMGARQLYIADVFDVDSSSRTQKPFGRIFYTQGKSLIFYAFDLDRQPNLKDTSAFQVWGRTEPDHGSPLNLGILYIDNQSNHRWALRFDDPQKLAEIDAMFVTVEPHGGSAKPTGKPFLYALLRKEANHR